MEASLQSAHILADEPSASQQVHSSVEEEEHHIHMPGPSLWPLILSAAILLTVTGMLFIPETPWLVLIGAPLVLVGILGWALEDPMGTNENQQIPRHPLDPASALDQARSITEQIVTYGSTAYSTHPIKLETEREGPDGIVLVLNGKVELTTQRQRLETALREIPGVANVRNYIVAEDSILSAANTRIAGLQSKGKLDGAKNISTLVENYILSLYGEVPNKDMKYTLEREMLGIPGVRVVINHIGLNKEIPGNLGKTLNKVGGV